jgi:hypothetical protein
MTFMTFAKSALSEIWGLFVDDGTFAAVLLAWCVVARVVLPRLSLPAHGSAVVFFLGCLAALLANILMPTPGRNGRRGAGGRGRI